MKAICLLLCLALAQGHIFRRSQQQRQRINQLDVQSSEYNNQEQRKQQNVPQASEMDHTKRVERINIDNYKPQHAVDSNEEIREYRENKQQYNPRIYQENLQLSHLPTMMRMAPADYIAYLKSWEPEAAYQKYERIIQEQTEQRQNPVAHDSTSEEKPWQTWYISEDSAPVVTYRDSMRESNKDVRRSPWAYSYPENQSTKNPPGFDALQQLIENIFNDARKTMKHLTKEQKEHFHQILEKNTEHQNEDSQLNATELLKKYRYPSETHTVKTSDGYLLTLFRIPPRTESPVQRGPVFLMHGLLGSADDWLLMGPNMSLAYMLSDAGYDVWLGNARGNKYSRRHVSKHPAQPDFWQYSNDEIALHDLPAMIDYVLKFSERRQMHYVGFSQGTTAFFALTAARPEYNEKIATMHALSPMVYMSETRSPMLRMIVPTNQVFERLYHQLGDGEFKPTSRYVREVGGSMCENEIGCKHVCSNINFVMAGVNVDSMDVEKIPVIMAHLPAGGSARQMKQYAQAVQSNEFTRYNYSESINKEVYGSSEPPKYDISKVEVPVVLYYSEDDWLAQPRDVERLAMELRNVQTVNVGPNFSHLDFQFSKTVPQVVYNRLIETIKQNSENIYY